LHVRDNPGQLFGCFLIVGLFFASVKLSDKNLIISAMQDIMFHVELNNIIHYKTPVSPAYTPAASCPSWPSEYGSMMLSALRPAGKQPVLPA
jgi:hypothetical protein